MERAIHSDGHQGRWSSWHLNSALKVEKDGIQGADRMTDAKTQRHEETSRISGMVTLPRPSLLILANAGPTSYSEGTPHLCTGAWPHSSRGMCPFSLFVLHRSDASVLSPRHEHLLPGMPLVLVITH